MIIKLKNQGSLISLDNIRQVSKFKDHTNIYLKLVANDGQEIKLWYGNDTYGCEFAKKRDEDFKQVEEILVSKQFNPDDVKDLIMRAADIRYSIDDMGNLNKDFYTCVMNFKRKYYD